MKWSAPVSLPAFGALFLLAVVWPLYARLARTLPASISAAGALTAVLFTVAALGGTLYGLGRSVEERTSGGLGDLERRLERALDDAGFAVPSGALVEKAQSTLPDFADAIIGGLSGFVLTVALFALALPEVRDYRRLVADDAILRIVPRVARHARRYLLVRTVVGLITGLAVAGVAWAIGLEYPLIWGLANFLLNYIPTLGSMVGIVPPVVFAWLSQDLGMALLTLGAIGGVQLMMGIIVDPLLQGLYLSLSPTVVLLSVILWGWVWGIPGAFLAVPVTSALIIGFEAFPRTLWIARLLAPRAHAAA